MKREILILCLAALAMASCSREALVEPAVQDDDQILVTSTVESSQTELITKGRIYDKITFNNNDQAVLFAISRSEASSTDMPQTDAVDFGNTDSFFWFKATGTYAENSALGSPFKMTGISTNPDASKYANVPGGYLDFFAFAPVPPNMTDISLRPMDPKYGSSYDGVTKSLWIDLHNDLYVDGYDLGGWTDNGYLRTHDPIDYIYAVDGNYTYNTPIVKQKKTQVVMRFRHALCLVEFKIYRTVGSAAALLNEIRIKPFQKANFLRITDGTIAASANGWGDGYYYRHQNVNYAIPAGQDNAVTLTQKFILCPNVGFTDPSLNYPQFDATTSTNSFISTWLIINGSNYYVQYGNDKTVFKPGYKYVVSVAMGLKGLTGTISAQPWVSETTQSISF